MQYDEIVKRVQEQTGLPTRLETVKALGAVLETLSERITKQEAKDLSAQLPDRLKAVLASGKNEDINTDRFPLEEFYQRVGARAELHYVDAVKAARGVMQVLQEAVSPGEMDDILAQLPDEYVELFGAPPGGPGSSTTLAA